MLIKAKFPNCCQKDNYFVLPRLFLRNLHVHARTRNLENVFDRVSSINCFKILKTFLNY